MLPSGYTLPYPSITVLAGPNGTGKSTIARTVLAEEYDVQEFVNADAIAAGLSPFHPKEWRSKLAV